MSRISDIFKNKDKSYLDYDAPYKRNEILIPSIILANVNQSSGYFNPGSPYARMDAYGLFLTEANVQFINDLILMELSKFPIKDIGCSIPEIMFRYRRIKRGDVQVESVNYNPIVELGFRNLEFVKETLKNILVRNEPQKASAKHHHYLMSMQNISDFYFKEVDWGTRYKYLGDVNSRNVYRWNNRIPPDRVSAQRRPYERDITDSLRARQLKNQIHGYDMSKLQSNTFKTPFSCNEYTRY